MLGINRGKSQQHTEENQTTFDEQTDTHAGVLYLQSSVEGEQWERDVIVSQQQQQPERRVSQAAESPTRVKKSKKKKKLVWAPELQGHGPIKTSN